MSSERKEVFLLSLAFQGFFDESYSRLIDSLHRAANIKRATKPDAANRYLEANVPSVIIVTDEGLTMRKHDAILNKIKSYVQDGGLVIVGFHFTSFTTGSAFDEFFNSFGLQWKRGDYHRSTFGFNPSCALPDGINRLSFPAAFSMKVLHVKDAKPNEKIFVPVDGALTQSLVFSPSPVDETQAAVVGAKCGAGFLIYAGDVNPEEGSDRVIMALCGF